MSWRSTKILSQIKNADIQLANYQYDPYGRRISKTVNGQTTYYLYTNEGLLAELDQQGNLQVAYGWQPDTEFGSSPLWQANLSQNTAATLKTAHYHYLHTDHLGTVQLATDSTGQVTWKAVSEAFGKTILEPTNQITMNLRFPGQYYDQETELHYNYFRDYDPSLGRYIESDPIGLDGGINIFGYVGANPVYFIDNLGLQVALDSVTATCTRNPALCANIGGAAGPANKVYASKGFWGWFFSWGSNSTTVDFPTWDTDKPTKAEEYELVDKAGYWSTWGDWNNEDPDCDRLGRDIDGLVKAIEFRIGDMAQHGGNAKENPSYGGHKTRVDNLKKVLEKYVDAAKSSKCPYNPKANDYLPPSRR